MSGVKIGNFVETKKSKIKSNSKVNHFLILVIAKLEKIQI